MDWLKKLLGEENYNRLSEDILKMLKDSFGETEYIANDPLKIVPKHVFNEKNEEVKHLKTQIEEYKKQIESVSGMITDKDLKTKLAEQEIVFKTQIAEIEKQHKKEIETQHKYTLVYNSLNNAGVKHSDLLMKIINLDDVIVKNDQVLNYEEVTKPLKETYGTLFEKTMTPGVLPKGEKTPAPSSREELIKQYNSAQQNGNFVQMQNIQMQIKALEK